MNVKFMKTDLHVWRRAGTAWSPACLSCVPDHRWSPSSTDDLCRPHHHHPDPSRWPLECHLEKTRASDHYKKSPESWKSNIWEMTWLTFPFQLGAIVVGPERVIIRRVHVVHIYVQVVWCFQEVVRKDWTFTFVQRQVNIRSDQCAALLSDRIRQKMSCREN